MIDTKFARVIAAAMVLSGGCALRAEDQNPKPAAPQQCQISGKVSDGSGTLLSEGNVKLFDSNGNQLATAGIVDQGSRQGYYTLPQVACTGPFTVQTDVPNHKSSSLKLIAGQRTADLIVYKDLGLLHAWVSFGVILLYLASIFIYRWHNIAVFDQKLLKAEIEVTRAQLEMEIPPSETAAKNVLIGLLDNAEKPYCPAKKEEARERGLFWINWFMWTRGDEIASWTLLRDVQRQIVALWPADSIERLRARLEGVEQDLRATKSPSAASLADNVSAALQKPSDGMLDRWKQLLSESLEVIYSAREDQFGTLTIWQSKSTWLALVACALMQASIALRGGGVLMVMGAAGGLMSRLGRSLHSDDAPTDYGASWTTLFLSPLLGALSGWFGLLLVSGFTELHILNQDIELKMSFYHETLPTLALAFVFGFSERLFDSLVKAVDDRLLNKGTEATKSADGNPPPPASGNATAITVKPPNPNPGDSQTIFGTALDQANVNGITLKHTASGALISLSPPFTHQDATSITFAIPQTANLGFYTLSVNAMHGPNPSTTIQVGPPLSLLTPTPNAAPPSTEIKVAGTMLDDSFVQKVEIFDSAGTSMAPTNLTQTQNEITFTSPANPGPYTLTVTPKVGNPKSQKFTVTAAVAG